MEKPVAERVWDGQDLDSTPLIDSQDPKPGLWQSPCRSTTPLEKPLTDGKRSLYLVELILMSHNGSFTDTDFKSWARLEMRNSPLIISPDRRFQKTVPQCPELDFKICV